MAEALYLVSKSFGATGTQTVNQVHAVLINADDGQTDGQIAAAAVTRVNAYFDTGAGMTPYPASYFDTVTKVSDLTAGPLKDAGDAYIFVPDSPPLKAEGS